MFSSSSLALFVQDIELFGALTDGLALLIGAVKSVEPGLDDRKGRDHRVDTQPGEQFELIDHAHVFGTDKGHVEHIVTNHQRAKQLVAAKFLGQESGQLLVNLAGFIVIGYQRQEQVFGIKGGDFLIRDVAALDQHELG